MKLVLDVSATGQLPTSVAEKVFRALRSAGVPAVGSVSIVGHSEGVFTTTCEVDDFDDLVFSHRYIPGPKPVQQDDDDL